MTEAQQERITAMADDPTMGQPDTPQTRMARALHYAEDGVYDGAHHKQWVIDQMVRALTGCPYEDRVSVASGDGTEYTYQVQGESAEYREWLGDEDIDPEEWQGIAP